MDAAFATPRHRAARTRTIAAPRAMFAVDATFFLDVAAAVALAVVLFRLSRQAATPRVCALLREVGFFFF